jgi:hypothetical protein
MSEYQNAVGGRLKLKGKALDVKEGGVKKKKKKKQHSEESSQVGHDELHEGFSGLPILQLLFKFLTIDLSTSIPMDVRNHVCFGYTVCNLA